MSQDDYTVIPPVLTVNVEDSMDIMIARDTARRVASLLGFAPAYRAQLAGASGALAELVLKTGTPHELDFHGVQDRSRVGVRVSCAAPWLADVAASNVVMALRAKLGDLVDEIELKGDTPPVIYLIMWLTSPRKMESLDARESDTLTET